MIFFDVLNFNRKTLWISEFNFFNPDYVLKNVCQSFFRLDQLTL